MPDWRTRPTRRRRGRRWRAAHGCGGRAYSRLASAGFEGVVHDLGKLFPGKAMKLAMGSGPAKRTLADLDRSEDRFVAPAVLGEDPDVERGAHPRHVVGGQGHVDDVFRWLFRLRRPFSHGESPRQYRGHVSRCQGRKPSKII